MNKEKFQRFYDKNYKKLLIAPAIILILSILYLGFFYIQTGDIINKDISLTGGIEISIFTDKPGDGLSEFLIQDYESVLVKPLLSNTGNQRELIITLPDQESSSIEEIKEKIGQYLEIKLTEQNSSVTFTGSTLAQDFYIQLIRAVIFAFLLMALVVFFVFGESRKLKAYATALTFIAARLTFSASDLIAALSLVVGISAAIYGLAKSKTKTDSIYSIIILIAFFALFFFPYYFMIIPISIALLAIYTFFSVPSIAVILSALADLIMPLAVVNLLGMEISAAGIVAFLMLIGYSVDTDILLTTRVLRRKQTTVNSAMFGALKTGMTMTLTSLVAIIVALLLVYNFQSILNQIFIILIIGLSFDIFNTWITNASLIKWYAEIKAE